MKLFLATIHLAVLLLPALPLVAAAAETPSTADQVRLKADTVSYEKGTDILRAQGNVEVRWDRYSLFSDAIQVHKGENEAVAEGNVLLLKDGNSLKGDRLRINYGTEQGEADNGDLFVKERNFHVRGARFLKTGKEEYSLERGAFTTCDGADPSWKFTATDLDVTVDGYATGRNALFYIHRVPVFYTPYILFPVMRERQSGLLFPRFGSSTKKGFYIDVPYYWAVSPSQDLTVEMDGQTKRGAGTSLDYRYLRPRGSGGEFKEYFIYDTQQERERGYLTLRALEFHSPSLTLTSDINLTLDRDFFRDYGETNGDYNRQLLDSTLFLTRNWEKSSFTAETRYVQNLDTPNNKETLEKLPLLTFTRIRSRLGNTPVYGGLDSTFTDFYRDIGIRGQRLDLHPTLAAYYAAPVGIDTSVWGGYRQRFYNAYDGDAGTGYHDAGLFDAGASLSSSLSRVYGTGTGPLRAVSHTLIPELAYTFVQEKNQEGLPFFDFDDRVVGQRMINLSLTNFVTGKYDEPAGPLYRDLLYLKLSQGYQLGGSRRDLLTLVDEGRRFTDLRVEARYSPVKMISITTDSRYNPYQTRFSTASLGFDLNDGRGDLAALSYRFARDQVEYLEGKAALSLVKPFIFNYNCRYSFDKGGFLEVLYSVEYKRQCWSVIFSYRDRPDDKGFVVSFALAGVGALGPMKAL